MLGINRQRVKQAFKQLWQRLPAQVLAVLMAAGLIWGSAGCSRSGESPGIMAFKPQRSRLTEVSPPFTIQSLKQSLEANQPQLEILSPKPGQLFERKQVEVKLKLTDLDLYKDEDLRLGSYLQVLLDSQPYAQIYDISQPLTLELTPGTHTIRAFAVRPWHESFKNDGAFAQTTFHVFVKTPENNPDDQQPLLTYNYPQGIYGAEPVLLDFFLTNAPLHLVAREDDKDEILDWQIRCTINGESFTFDRWEPIYLKGFKPGTNWVQLELLDEKGEPLSNAFNNTVQLFSYEPGGNDTLAQLTRGELTAEDARKIVDPNYLPPVIAPEPEAIEPEIAEPEAEPKIAEPEAEPEIIQPAEPKGLEAEPEAEPEEIKPARPESPRAEPKIAEPEMIKPKITEPEPEAILEPDLTQKLTPEEMPPEVIAPAQPRLQPLISPKTPVLPPVLPEKTPAPTPMPALPLPDFQSESQPESQPELLEPNGNPAPSTSLASELAKPKPAKPDMFGALDQVKGFFEGLRKQPDQVKPLFSQPDSSSSNLPSGEATIVDTLMESLPDSLRKPLMEERLNETTTASPASPD